MVGIVEWILLIASKVDVISRGQNGFVSVWFGRIFLYRNMSYSYMPNEGFDLANVTYT